MKCVNASKMSSTRLVEERDKLVGSGRYHATRHEARLRLKKKKKKSLSSSLYNIKWRKKMGGGERNKKEKTGFFFCV